MISHRARPGGGRRSLPAWQTTVLGLALVAQGGVALWLGDRGWFSGDLMHYFVARGGIPGASEGLMAPHSAHWQPVLITGYLLMFKLIGLHSYLPYLAVTVAVHLALVAVMYRLLQRLGAGRTVALVCAVVLLTYGAGSEAFIVEAPVALTSAMLLGAVAHLVLLRGGFGARSLLVVNALLLVSVMLSLGGVVASVWVGFFALSRGLLTMIRAVALPAVAFLAWFLVWGRDATRVGLSGSEVLQVPEAAWTLLVAPLDNASAGWGAGPVLLLAVLTVTFVRSAARPELASAALAGLVAAMTHALLSAVAQLPYGLEQVTTSRYRYVVLVALLPGLALLLDAAASAVRGRLPVAQRRAALVPAALVAGTVLVHAGLGQYRVGNSVEDIGDTTRQLLAGTVAAVETGERTINDSVRGSYISGEDLERLADPAVAEELPDLEPTAEDRIAAESNYFVTVTGDETDLGTPRTLRSDSFVPEMDEDPGCRSYTATNATPTLTIDSFIGAGIRIRGPASSVTTRLRRPAEGVVGEPIAWAMSPDEWTYVATTAQLAYLDVTFDAGGRYTVCAP